MDEQGQSLYDPEKLARLIKRRDAQDSKNYQIRVASLCYYYGMSIEDATNISYGDAELLIKAARVFKAQETLQQIAAITAALSGGKASKLIKQLEKEAKW